MKLPATGSTALSTPSAQLNLRHPPLSSPEYGLHGIRFYDAVDSAVQLGHMCIT